MKANATNILSGIFILLLIITLFMPHKEEGFYFLIGLGIFALIVSIFITNDIKKLKNSKKSKILSVILVNLTLLFSMQLFYGLSNIGMGDKGLMAGFTWIIHIILLAIATIVGVVMVLVSKEEVNEKKINKKLSIILGIILIIIFYNSIIFGSAFVIQAPNICSLQIELKQDSFIFRNGIKDNCIYDIALKTLNPNFCDMMKDKYTDIANSRKNHCFLNVARYSENTEICYRIINDDDRRGSCIEYIANRVSDLSLCEIPEVLDKDGCYSRIARGEREGDGNQEICNYIENDPAKYHCFGMIAIDKRDPIICKDIPSEIDMSDREKQQYYSKEECMAAAERGSWN